MNPEQQPRFEITLQELYQIIGELEVIRRKQAEQLVQQQQLQHVPTGPGQTPGPRGLRPDLGPEMMPDGPVQ